MIYCDTSALLKRYLHEHASDDFDALFMNRGPLSISRLSIVEARCSLARRRRNRQIDSATEVQASKELLQDIRDGALVLHGVGDAHFSLACELIETLTAMPLRSLDAVHLAIAREIRATAFATADRIQAEAAAALGLAVHRFY
ncbi:type II toxin-antitoxin system VapC family toxin [Sulfuricystis multivorans]|uniref:type II toxin-antitoxin system VapC family toxin n=1 Tax=Sulfuricystis multivorans TaxID=2211108 RepID=UPI000F81DBE8|nr:type II toxin-antitoxin system VapC family toxin [Sulfuricystis multivorans]